MEQWMRDTDNRIKQERAYNDEKLHITAQAIDDLQRQINDLKKSSVVDHAAHIRDIILKDSGLTVREEITLYIQTCRDLKLL